MLASSSRADLGAFVLALVVALIVRKDLKTAIWVAFSAAVLFTVLSTVDISAVLAKIMPEEHRATSFARLASGEVTGVVQEDIRWKVWQYASRVAMDNAAVGCGLTCMDHVAPYSTRGLGPHNFYLYVLGTSGILALMAFLLYQSCLFLWAFQVKELLPRAMSVAYVAGFAMMLMFDHAFPMIQAMCPMFLFFAVFSAEKDDNLPAAI
jgi:O-antigen ligase